MKLPEFYLNQGRFASENYISNIEQIDNLEEYLDFISKNTLVTSLYLSGRKRVGASSENSVVDQNLKLGGVGGAFIVDESIFPSSVGPYFMDTVNTLSNHFLNNHK